MKRLPSQKRRFSAGLLALLPAIVSGQSAGSGELRPLGPRILESLPKLSKQAWPQVGETLALEFADEPLELFHALASLQFLGEETYVGGLEDLPEAKHLILASFGHLGHPAMLACLDELSSSGLEPTTPQFLAAVKLVRFFDEPGDYLNLARFMNTSERSEGLHPKVEAELVRVFEEAFLDSAPGRETFVNEWTKWNETVASAFIRASTRVGGSEDYTDLVLLLGRRSDLDPTVLYALAGVPFELSPWEKNWVADFIGKSLWSNDVTLLRAATSATERFPMGEIIPSLIALLTHEDTGVRLGAHRALGHRTGLRFPASAKMWSVWLTEQEHWYDIEAPEVFSQLTSEDRGEVTRAIRLLALHQLHRDELGEELVVTLSHPDAYVRQTGCEALSSMNVWTAVGDLVEILEDEDARVQTAAHKALKRITGQTLPRDSRVWDHWLQENEAAKSGAPVDQESGLSPDIESI